MIVLASASPRRLELLESAGWIVECDPSGAVEVEFGLDTPAALAMANARLKWGAVAHRHAGVVLSADTVVWMGGKSYGKPADRLEARRMLTELSGATHEVVTGVKVGIFGDRVVELHVSSRVTFRAVDEAFICDYVERINPLDKAAGYAAQGDNGRLISRIEGPLSNVIGLPIEKVQEVLSAEFGLSV
jgi:septum formation protein